MKKENPLLSIIIPIYNEEPQLEEVLERVYRIDYSPKELILVDDFSHDGTRQILDRYKYRPDTRVLLHEANRGKGFAIRTGLKSAEGEIVIIQDADLEYDPNDYAALLAPLIAGEAAVVFGTRWGRHARTDGLWRKVHAMGNRVLTGFSNLLTGHRVSDMECCYKVFTVSALRTIRPRLTEERFGIEPQIAAAVARHRLKLVERPVTYAPREVAEGKKIRARDGFRAFWVMVRERFRR